MSIADVAESNGRKGGFTIPSLRCAAISALAGSILRGQRDPAPAFLQPQGEQDDCKLSRADSEFACYWSQSCWEECGAGKEHSFGLDSEPLRHFFQGDQRDFWQENS